MSHQHLAALETPRVVFGPGQDVVGLLLFNEYARIIGTE